MNDFQMYTLAPISSLFVTFVPAIQQVHLDVQNQASHPPSAIQHYLLELFPTPKLPTTQAKKLGFMLNFTLSFINYLQPISKIPISLPLK